MTIKTAILAALMLACLSGCERYARVGETSDRLIVRDTVSGQLYVVEPGGWMKKINPPSD
jgi:hypothetical protein